MTVEPFGRMPDGGLVNRYTLRSRCAEVSLIPYGARIASIRVPDRHGHFDDVTLGFDALDDYITDSAYFGATVGRYANRIAQARFELNGGQHALVANDGVHCLHGGAGFDHRLWDVAFEGSALCLRYLSPHGEAGFPGNLSAQVRYSLLGPDLCVDYSASTDRHTVVNLSNHAYFNLGGTAAAGSTVLDHMLQIPARFYLAVDAGLIPVGLPKVVTATPFDFVAPHRIGERINDPHEQLALGHGYDHCWAVDQHRPVQIRPLASLHDPVSGRRLEVLSTEPGVQFYSGNFLDGSTIGRGGVAYGRHAGLCLEPQHFPDSPNRPDFPSTALAPGQTYRSRTVYRFTTDRAGVQERRKP